ncbi:NTPase KAP [Pantoea sp. Al-1710]|uniref:NTPase KAP n=1 Tax=Candidatus Pantoea communis TaxID=2608354 RepID=A0ABX0RUH5_9GAMM|nr:P-loop NTPase fold protein [Pantoea communis]NIG21246.1 NTPase KAP [Pantoea communis]
MDNRHTQEFINYYLDLKTEPQYAIMIKGAWGSGKTWFIERVLREYKTPDKEFKFLKVSLYGINTIEQIEDEFYRQLHPVLSNKALIFGANVLKNTLKASFKIDLNGDSKPDLDINASIPSINLSDFSREPNGFVLVFDDIERTSIELTLLFGYINHFVEVNGYKAILIANEDEIIKSEKRKNNDDNHASAGYIRKKEKLIGRTFEVVSDLHGACGEFLGKVSSRTVAKAFKADMQSVEALYRSAGYNNLRHLRQYFLDVERITNLLGVQYVKNDEFMGIFCRQLLIFSMEYRGGNLSHEEFDTIGKINYSLMLGDKKQDSKYDKIVQKYSSPVLSEKLLDGKHWRELICDGKVTDELRTQLDITRFFRSASAQAWEYLWNFRQLRENVLSEQYDIARDNLFSGKITEFGELLMTASILIELANEGLTKDVIQDIINETNHQTDSHYSRMGPKEIQHAFVKSRHNELMAWQGMGFLNRDGDDFKAIREHAKVAQQNRFDSSLEEFAAQFSEELKKGDFTFLSELSLSDQTRLRLFELPFLHLTDPALFIDSFRQLDPVVMKRVSFSLKNRYDDELCRSKLHEEYDWLTSLKTTADGFISDLNSSRFQVFHVKEFTDYILANAIALFEPAQT